MKDSLYSLLSGAFASGGSIFGKLSGLNSTEFEYFILIKITFFILMVLSNTFGCTFYVKALHATDSSLSVTVVSAATNYFLSVLSGYLFFGEIFSMLSWCGVTFLLWGLVLITKDERSVSVVNKKEK